MQILNLPYNLAGKQPIVFYDGECSLCNKSVQFLLRHNHKGNLSFSSLQSDSGLAILSIAGITVSEPDTLILLQENKVFTYSTAAIKITAHLEFPWRLLLVFRIIPTGIRDKIYRYVARNRFKWFGRESNCLLGEQVPGARFIS